MAIFGLVSAVAGFVKVRYVVDRAVIDNTIFRLHYRITSAILFACCIILTANNLIGDPIACINDGAVPRHVINTYCWITYTFTLPGHYTKPIGTHVAHPGLGNDYQEKIYHSYYQWVPFMLFFQGVMFYVPHWIWKNWEQNKINLITSKMRGLEMFGTKNMGRLHITLVNYLEKSMGTHNVYAFGYFFCEILNFVNVILNIFMVDKFLGGAFFTYGTRVINFSNMNQENRFDPMVEIFPRVTKCIFHKYGSSGSLQKHDALCVLALNILNEKIYIFLWFWFIILAILSGMAVVYSAIVVMMPSMREMVMRKRILLRCHNFSQKFINSVQIGDFLIFQFLERNIPHRAFIHIMSTFALLCTEPRSRRDSILQELTMFNFELYTEDEVSY